MLDKVRTYPSQENWDPALNDLDREGHRLHLAGKFVHGVRGLWAITGTPLPVTGLDKHAVEIPELEIPETETLAALAKRNAAQVLEAADQLDLEVNPKLLPHIFTIVAREMQSYESLAVDPPKQSRAQAFIADVRERWGARVFNRKFQDHEIVIPGATQLAPIKGLERQIRHECAKFLEMCHLLKIKIDNDIRPDILREIAHEVSTVVIQKHERARAGRSAAAIAKNANPEFKEASRRRLIEMNADPAVQQANIDRMKKRHEDPDWAQAHSERASKHMTALHQDPAFAEEHRLRSKRTRAAQRATPELAAEDSERSRQVLTTLKADPAFEEARLQGLHNHYADYDNFDPEAKARQLKGLLEYAAKKAAAAKKGETESEETADTKPEELIPG